MVANNKLTSEQIDAAFQAANKFVSSSDPKSGPSLSNADKLQFYALFKQATVGPCSGKQPSRLKIVARAKYDAWKSLGAKMTQQDAKLEFVELLRKKQPNFAAPKL